MCRALSIASNWGGRWGEGVLWVKSEVQCLEYMENLSHWCLGFVTQQRYNHIILPLWQNIEDRMENYIFCYFEEFMMCSIIFQGVDSIFCHKLINLLLEKTFITLQFQSQMHDRQVRGIENSKRWSSCCHNIAEFWRLNCFYNMRRAKKIIYNILSIFLSITLDTSQNSC